MREFLSWVLSLSLTLVLVLVLVACGGGQAEQPPESSVGQPAEGTTEATAPDSPSSDVATEEVPDEESDAEAGASSEEPSSDGGEVVRIGSATWETGWFQADILAVMLEELGYTVEISRPLENEVFYQAAAQGEVDLWPNGWFPIHNVFLQDQAVVGLIEPIGFEVEAGALQGYLVDNDTAEQFNITSLDDFKRSEVVEAFDTDGNGKANLMGCNVGWGCERVIEHQLDAYELRDTVEHVQGTYSELMEETIERYEQGEPVFFYTWTPNWTVGKMIPGVDVVWIEVPFASLPEDQVNMEDLSLVNNVLGCVNDPCEMGFPPNDIRVVGNSEFLDSHPDIELLVTLWQVPLVDISIQNSKMYEGAESDADLRRHAEEWVSEHREEVDNWLEQARAVQP